MTAQLLAPQRQIQKPTAKRETPPVDAPTTSKRMAKLWFGGQS
jgi:hypothetical protein